jgi:hypothetical protein
MEMLINVGKWLVQYGPELLAAIVLILSGVMGVFMLVPGEQPEKTLQKILDFLKKFSKKPEIKEEA